MQDFEKEINDFHKSQVENIYSNIEDSEKTREVIKSVISSNLSNSENREGFLKGFGSDLQKRFPNGRWVTMSGARVFVNGGKVVAGLDGFNQEIDKFFEQKKGKSEAKKESVKNKDRYKHVVQFEDNSYTTVNYHEPLSQKELKNIVKDSGKKIKDVVTTDMKADKKDGKQENKKDHMFFVSDRDKELAINQELDKLSKKDLLREKQKNSSRIESDPKNYFVVGILRDKNKLIDKLIDAHSEVEKQNKPQTSKTSDKSKLWGQGDEGKVDKKESTKEGKNYAFNVTVNGEKFYAQKVRGRNKYIAFDKDGNRLNEGLQSSKRDFEELVKDGLKQKKRDENLDKKPKQKKKRPTTLKTFEGLAKKSKSPEEFVKKIREFGSVPSEVTQAFWDKYGDGGKLSPEKAAEKMWNEINEK